MEYINNFRLFEKSETFSTETFFKDKINWKFINFVQYTLQEAEDEGYETNIVVAVRKYNKWTHGSDIENVWATRAGYISYTKERLDDMKLAYEDSGLFFIVRMQKNEEQGLDFKKEHTIYKKIKRVYNLIPDDTETQEKIRFYKIP